MRFEERMKGQVHTLGPIFMKFLIVRASVDMLLRGGMCTGKLSELSIADMHMRGAGVGQGWMLRLAKGAG